MKKLRNKIYYRCLLDYPTKGHLLCNLIGYYKDNEGLSYLNMKEFNLFNPFDDRAYKGRIWWNSDTLNMLNYPVIKDYVLHADAHRFLALCLMYEMSKK